MQNPIKLFEIPVYGLTEETLKKRIDGKIKELETECKVHNVTKEHQQALIELQTFPMRNWEYNHIVGFISISTDTQDMFFNVYLPYDGQGNLPKYFWWSRSKHFVLDSGATGLHFYLGNVRSNEEVRQRTSEMLYNIIKERIPKRYFVDMRAFEAINAHIDYLALL